MLAAEILHKKLNITTIMMAHTVNVNGRDMWTRQTEFLIS